MTLLARTTTAASPKRPLLWRGRETTPQRGVGPRGNPPPLTLVAWGTTHEPCLAHLLGAQQHQPHAHGGPPPATARKKRRPPVNPIVFAMRHPVTMLMLVVALIGGGALALNRMRIDIFPPINQPQIFVFVNFGGYDPGQIEGIIVNQFELEFQYG